MQKYYFSYCYRLESKHIKTIKNRLRESETKKKIQGQKEAKREIKQKERIWMVIDKEGELKRQIQGATETQIDTEKS